MLVYQGVNPTAPVSLAPAAQCPAPSLPESAWPCAVLLRWCHGRPPAGRSSAEQSSARHVHPTLCGADPTRLEAIDRTVDGENPALVDRWFIPLLLGFQPSFWCFHPQHFSGICRSTTFRQFWGVSLPANQKTLETMISWAPIVLV